MPGWVLSMEVSVKLADKFRQWLSALQGIEDPRGDELRRMHEALVALAGDTPSNPAPAEQAKL
jgi:hypothetical protein